MTDFDTGPAKRPTIYDIAQLAGVSAGAVSSILNGTWKKRRISATTANRVAQIAEELGYFVNLQASMLSRERSHVIGMIVPKYDNRYFGAIAEQFEAMARARGLFPVITCTRRDPELEFEAARELVAYQAESLIVTGATDPDRIAEFCAAAGVRTVNLDLPGSKAPSIISDNYGGAMELTRHVLSRMTDDFGKPAPLWFVGGRKSDHNTAERLRGFTAAHHEFGLSIHPDRIVTPGYSSTKVAASLADQGLSVPSGIFVNSTIAMEGVMQAIPPHAADQVRIGCFDWDPFAALLPQTVWMARQDVSTMLLRLFEEIDKPSGANDITQIPCILIRTGG